MSENIIPVLSGPMTIGQCYANIAKVETSEQAAEYFAALVAWSTTEHGHTREHAADVQAQNIGYLSGYYDAETGTRIRHLFGVRHPVFGAI